MLTVAFIAMEWQLDAVLLAVAIRKWQLVADLQAAVFIAIAWQLDSALLRPVAGLQGSTWVQ